MTRGVRSTEFWLTIAVNLAALISALADAMPANVAGPMAVAATGLYALSRGWAKNEAPPK